MDGLKTKQPGKAIFLLVAVIGYVLLYALLCLYAVLRYGNESFVSQLLTQFPLASLLESSWYVLTGAFVLATLAFILRSKRAPLQYGSSKLLLYWVYFGMILSAVVFVDGLVASSGEKVAIEDGSVLVQRNGIWEQTSGTEAVQFSCRYLIGKLAKLIVVVCALVSIWVSKWVGWNEKVWGKSQPMSRQKL